MKAMKFLSMAAICVFGSALLFSGCSESGKSSGHHASLLLNCWNPFLIPVWPVGYNQLQQS